jgi:hypothetical protein
VRIFQGLRLRLKLVTQGFVMIDGTDGNKLMKALELERPAKDDF